MQDSKEKLRDNRVSSGVTVVGRETHPYRETLPVDMSSCG